MIELVAVFLITLLATYFVFKHNCLLSQAVAPIALASLVTLFLYMMGY